MGVEPQDQEAWTTAEAAFILGAPLGAFKKPPALHKAD